MTPEEHLSPRERVRCALRHEVPDRTPLFIKAEKEVWPRLRQHLGVADNEDVMQRLGIDIRTVGARYVGPQREVYGDGSFIDVLGHHRKVAEHPFGTYYEYAGFPLAGAKNVDDLLDYNWPQADWWDVSHIADEIEALNRGTDYAILYEAGSVFETGWGLRGLDTFLMDMILAPDVAHFILERWADFWIDLGRKVLEAAGGRVDIAWTWDDIGTQNGPMISPEMWEAQIKPHHVRINAALKEYDVTLMYHTCGSIMPFIDGLIDMGVEILNPLQPRAKGMDLPYIKATYGDRLSFHGGMDIQRTLPHGTPGDVADEVRDRIEVLGAGGGYILAPAHMMQGDTAAENIVTMYDTARRTPVSPGPAGKREV
jgi:uroporphyrinogen decarboxylase